MPDIVPHHNNADAWESHYQAGEWPWDQGAPHPEIAHRAALWGTNPLRILVPGCGRGHDVRAWAAVGHHVVGLDLSPEAVRHAEALPSVSDERYVVGDLFELPEEWTDAFDLVWEHTCYCALHPDQRAAYTRAVEGVLRPGGRLAGVFFCHPDKPMGEGPPFSSRPDDVAATLGAEFEQTFWEPVQAEYADRTGVEWFGLWTQPLG